MYLRGRSGEKKKEMPLMLVEGQPYIHYNKGSLAFYALRDYIGEDSLNAALRRYLKDKGFQNPPYTMSTDLLQYIRAVTPDSLQYVIHDLFETITLYDNKADTATATKRPDGTYAVHLAFSAKKLRADSLGNQTEIPVADYIDAGVFGAPEPGNKLGKPLAVRKVHVTGQPDVGGLRGVRASPQGGDRSVQQADRPDPGGQRAHGRREGVGHHGTPPGAVRLPQGLHQPGYAAAMSNRAARHGERLRSTTRLQ